MKKRHRTFSPGKDQATGHIPGLIRANALVVRPSGPNLIPPNSCVTFCKVISVDTSLTDYKS
jgi:hypothetical protein